MAVRKKMTDAEEFAFENELLYLLKKDPDHQFAFDGKLKMYSSRYLQAVNVHWDEQKQDVVFVGCYVGGKPKIDMSRGYPVMETEISIPFRECFKDMREHEGYSAEYLVSKTRRAVIGKALDIPMRQAASDRLLSGGVFRFGDFAVGSAVRVKNQTVAIGSVEVGRDGSFVVRSADGPEIAMNTLSIVEIWRIGSYISDCHALARNIRKEYLDEFRRGCPDGRTHSDLDVRMAEERALYGIYKAFVPGYPLTFLNSVAKSFSKSYPDVFNTAVHSEKDIAKMMKAYESGKRFGVFGNRPGL